MKKDDRRPPRGDKPARGGNDKGRPDRSDRNGGRSDRGDDRAERGDKPMRSRGFKDRPGGGRPPRNRDDRHDGEGGERKPFKGARGMKDRPGPDTVRAKPRFDDRKPRFDDRNPRPPRDDASEVPVAPEGERIAKRLARAGVASRREAETIIMAGRVKLNGKVLTTPAVNVTLDDRIEIDGKPLPQAERTRLWLYHKLPGLVTSNRDPEGRPTVFENLPSDLPRVITVGRLDINTEGLLLLTNDGGLARVLELPQTGWLRRYRVRAHGRVTQNQLDKLKDGISVDGVFYGAINAVLERTQGTNAWIEMTLREGKNREIKNVLGALNLEVNRLIRTSYGPFQLADLPEGHVLEIKGKVLREQLGAKLVEESGATFDAPVLTQFPNRPVAKTNEETPVEEERQPTRRRGDWVSSSGNRRDEPLEKLATKPPRSGATNVWHGKGARPQGKKSRPSGPRKPSGPKRDR